MQPGDTLWVVTGVPRKGDTCVYTLAYKLAGCEHIPADQVCEVTGGAFFCGQYAVFARDAHHFSLKPKRRAELTPHISRLRFENVRPVTDPSRFPVWLYNFPVLKPESAAILERLERRSLYGRDFVLSYAREDSAAAQAVQHGLEVEGLSVFRDLTNLRAGEDWRKGVQEALSASDALIVLLSASSARSEAVLQEVRWALEQVGQPAALRTIVPIILPGASFAGAEWDRFVLPPGRNLRDFTAATVPPAAGQNFWASLARQIAEIPPERR